MGCTGQHSGCNLSLLFGTYELSEPGYWLVFQEKRPKTEQDWKQMDSFFSVNRQGAGYCSSLRLSLLMIISIVMLKEWKSHLIFEVCQAPLTVPLEPCVLWRTTASNAGTHFWMGLLIQLGRKIYDKEAQNINKVVFSHFRLWKFRFLIILELPPFFKLLASCYYWSYLENF